MTHSPIKYYVVMRPHRKDFQEAYRKRETDTIAKYVAWQVYGRDIDQPPFSVRSLPSIDIHTTPDDDRMFESLRKLVVALDVKGDPQRSPSEVVEDIIRAAESKTDVFAGSSPDIPFASVDHWCVGDAANPIFSDRSAAERTVGIDYLRTQPGLLGDGVNVVIVDQGLDRQVLGSRYGGGWQVGKSLPGSSQHQTGSIRPPHGMMVAHNVLKVAPKATLFDLPIAPTRIADIQAFLSDANSAYIRMLADIAQWRTGSFPGPWILVNPWGVLDRRTEHPLGHYTENPNSPLNVDIASAVAMNIDVVFAAGNCGQFCPDDRCGARDKGPSRSIWGANSLAPVFTVGAVRADDMWIGYSSQGPGQPRLGSAKPDVCLTSQFCEDGDAFIINTGTSAACGLAGGVVAALRSRWDAATVPPPLLQTILNQTARKPKNVPWSNSMAHRLGNGILDLRAALGVLSQY